MSISSASSSFSAWARKPLRQAAEEKVHESSADPNVRVPYGLGETAFARPP
jgi:hypothetical protein